MHTYIISLNIDEVTAAHAANEINRNTGQVSCLCSS